jgi:4-alpha-glucanotransferase
MKRAGGILLHITSLPGQEGIGTFGEEALQFVNKLTEAGQKLWQILPLGPTGYGNSPYQCYSAFAGNPLLIDLEELVKEGLLLTTTLKKIPNFNKHQVDFQKVEVWKYSLLRQAFDVFKSENPENRKREFMQFINEHGWWLNDYSLFMACKSEFKDILWNQWEKGLKFRESEFLKKYESKLEDEIEFHKFLQFIFFRQWFRLKSYAYSKGIQIIGDLPLYVSTDSSDVWTNPDIFLLDQHLVPTHVGGVPPDYFSENGQLWGNPVYNWQRLKERGFDWWMARLHFNLRMFNLVRIDHFRGLESFWSVEAKEKTAVRGEWVPAYGYELLEKFREQIGDLHLIAEDLGVITPEVERLRDDFNLPGMKILQFAFSSDATNKDLPHNYSRNFLAYTGTHDNDTTQGWFKLAGTEERQNIRKYFKGNKRRVAAWAVETIWASVADVAIAPLQDILGLNSKARMNIPGIATGNWGWRLKQNQFKSKHIRFLKELSEKFGR